MSEKSSFSPADILDVVEAATPREVAAESTAGFTWDVLEQALKDYLSIGLMAMTSRMLLAFAQTGSDVAL